MSGFQGKHRFSVPVELMDDPSPAAQWIRDTARKLQEQQKLLERASETAAASSATEFAGTISGGGGAGAVDVGIRSVIQAHPGGSALVTFTKKLPDNTYVPSAKVFYVDFDGVTISEMNCVITNITQFGFTIFCPQPGTLKATAVRIQ